MPLDQNKLARLQLAAMLGLVVTVVALLASYFFYQQWRDYQQTTALYRTQAEQRGQAFLRAWGEHATLTLSSLHQRSNDVLRQQVREQVDAAHALATAIWTQQQGKRPEALIRQDIIEALRPLRYFGGRGYIFVDTMAGDCVLLPTNPSLEGSSLIDNRDVRGTYIMRELISAVRQPGEAGFTRYFWYRPGEKVMAEKIAYARQFKPLNWLIGSGEYVRNVNEDQQKLALSVLANMKIAGRGGFNVFDEKGRLRLHFDEQSANHDDLHQRMRTAPPGSVLQLSRNDNGQPVHYTAYVSVMPEWQWRIVAIAPTNLLMATGEDGTAKLLPAQMQQRVLATLGIFIGALVLSWLFSLRFSRWMRQLVGSYREQLEQKQAELARKARALELTRHMSDSAGDIIVLRNAEGDIVYQNQRASECFDGDCAANVHQLFGLALADGEQAELTVPCCVGNLLLEVQYSSVSHGHEHYRCVTARDITARHAQQAELRLAAKVFESSTEAILITDPASRILAVNRAFTDITGYSEAEALGQTPALLNSGRHDETFYHDLWNHLHARGQWAGEIWNRRKNGDIYPEWLSISALRDEAGQLTHYVALFTDITERKEAEALVRHLAEYDALTDLPNRLLLQDRLQQALRVAGRTHHKVAVLFMDLDRFKNINDSLGHACGDKLLQAVAQRTRGVIRDMDTLGRTGGDEFVMILPELMDSTQAAHIADRVVQAMQAPFLIDHHQLVITASIGIAISPDDGSEADVLLKNADMALYAAKAHGRNNYRFFTARMTAEATERLQLENKLRQAIPAGELSLALQPKYRIADRQLTGFEALLRWTDADGQAISPTRFIPVAEDSGLIVDIGDWVLVEACREASRFAPPAGTAPLTIAINVSPRQLVHGGFAERVAACLADTGLPPAQLEIEVTESALLERTGVVRRELDSLKALGVRLAVDDFGTGYSSLAYLKDFAPDTVKIDRSFVTDLPSRPDNAAIALAIITLARSLGMESLAEGAETEEELAVLAQLGCDTVQGYLTGRPLPVAEAQALARRG